MSRPGRKTHSAWSAEDEDVQLMLRFQRGEQEAFTQLVERNTPKVHALVFRFLGQDDLAEDLTQEVFIRIYRTAPRYKPTAKFSTWLYRIVANLSFNVLRTRKRVHPLSLDMSGGEDGENYSRQVEDDRNPPPAAAADSRELAATVSRAIDELPESQKIAIILNKYEEKNYDDIADVLEISTMAVKSLLSRARTNLRASLGRYLREVRNNYKGKTKTTLTTKTQRHEVRKQQQRHAGEDDSAN